MTGAGDLDAAARDVVLAATGWKVLSRLGMQSEMGFGLVEIASAAFRGPPHVQASASEAPTASSKRVKNTDRVTFHLPTQVTMTGGNAGAVPEGEVRFSCRNRPESAIPA